MPVIEISTLPPARDLDVTRALTAVTTEVAGFLGEDPRGTWAIYQPIAPGHYAEGDDAAVVRAFRLEEGNVFVRFEPADPERMFWG